MAKKPQPDTSGEVPLWFMTYSDTVTLLMTFFILLLTFASTEPESFEKIQITMFGPGGSTGFASKMEKGVRQDGFAARIRPPASRMSMQGSEIPPLEDTSKSTVDGKLSGLEDEQVRDIVQEYRINVSLNEFVSKEGEIYPYGQRYLDLIGRQLTQMPYEAVFEVPQENSLDRAIACSHYLFVVRRLPTGKTAVSINPKTSASEGQMAIVIRKHARN